ncbi:hypothetical protein ALQ89_06468 [Pseudomonas amygdali pv. tabaci]|uniref:Uncharacterized protein n=1 Tax=Pseudomonas amygdali pv. tabaci TaxID=322 RepID=A0AAX1VUY8_PSEAJ|nr:hypothetical protein ALQ89_06468 [Pseudomonas amygdali pv. tabaci]
MPPPVKTKPRHPQEANNTKTCCLPDENAEALVSITAGVQRFRQSGFYFARADTGRFVHFTTTLALAVISQTGTGRDQTTHNHVFLQAAQIIALASHSRLGQHAGCLLEGGRGDERLGGQRCLGDTQQHASELGDKLVFRAQTLVFYQYVSQFHLVTLDETGIARLGNFNLAQHLTQNRLDVLVVDLHALQTVYILNLVNDVLGQRTHTQQTQDVVWIARTVGDNFAAVHLFAFEDVQVTPLRNQLFVRIATVVRGNDQTALALGLFTECDGTADFCKDRRLFRTTGFEQVGNTRQTTGDVTSLRSFLRNTSDNITDRDLRTVSHTDQGVGRQEVLSRYVSTRQQQILAIQTDHLHSRTDVLAGSRTVFGVKHFNVGHTGQLVCLTLDRDAFFHADVGNSTFHLGNDWVSVRIPLGHDRTSVDLVAFLHRNHCTVWQLVTLTLATEVISDGQFTGAGYRNQVTVNTLNVLQVVKTDSTAILHLNAVGCRGPACRTTNVERTHCQLGTRLTDRLCSDYADSFTDVNLVTASQVATVALGTDAVARFTADWRANDHFVDAVQLDELDPLLVYQCASRNDDVFCARLEHVTGDNPTQYALTQRLYNVTAFNVRSHQQTVLGTAIHLGNDQILSNVYQTASQITGVSGFQCGIRKTLTSTVSGDEVLKYAQTFTEVRSDRRFDDGAVRLGHQTTHTSQLTNLGSRTTRTGVSHHVHRVEGFLVNFDAMTIDDLLFREVRHHCLGHFVVGLGPEVDHLVVLLALGYQAGGVLTFDLFNFFGGRVDDASFFIRDNEVVNADGNTRNGRVGKTGVHQLVSEDHGLFQTNHAVTLVDQLGDRLLLHRLVDDVVGQAGRNHLEQQRTADSGVDDTGVLDAATVTVVDRFVDTNLDLGMQSRFAGAEYAVDFLQVRKHTTFALGVDRFTSHVIQTQYNVLRRNDDWLTVGWRQNVLGRHHQRTRFELSFQRQRYVNGHLVAVEVGVVRSTDQRVQLNSLTFDQYWFKRLDAQTVKRWRAVQKHRVFANYFSKNVPDLWQLALDHLLGSFDGRGQATHFQLAENERFEQLESHFFRQTALVQTQGRTYGNYRTARVVNALTEQVLTETTLLTLDHVSQGLQRTLVGTCDRTTATTVVEQRIDRFLQHALFVAHDDVGSRQIQQTLQTVVTVDHSTIQIVEVGRRETATVKRNQRTQIWRQNRQNGQHHPLREVAGTLEGFHQFQTLGQLLDFGFGIGLRNFFTQTANFVLQINSVQQFADSLGTHAGVEVITELFKGFEVLLVVQQLTFFKGSHAWIDNDIALEVENALDITQGHVHQQADTGRQRFQEPDVRNRRSQLDVSHALATNLGQCYFNTAFFADDTAVLQALVLTAQALVIFYRAKDLGAEQTVTLRLERTVVNGFRLFNFTERPRADHLRRCKSDTDCVELFDLTLVFQQIQ